MTPAQTRAKYATIQKRKTLAATPKHRAHAINAAPRQDQSPVWHVVCADCAHEWRITNAFDHGVFKNFAAAETFVAVHDQINRTVITKGKT